MNAARVAALLPPRDVQVAGASCAACGLGATLILLAAAGAASTLQLAMGVALLGGGMVIVLAAGWIDSLSLLIVSLPLPALYRGADGRLAPALLITALVLGAWIVTRAVDHRPLLVRGLPWRAAGALFGALCVASLLAVDHAAAAKELVSWVLLFGLLAFFAGLFTASSTRIHDTARLLALMGAVCGAVALLQGIGVIPTGFRMMGVFYRATLGFGWPNEGGMFLALLVPFAAYACAIARDRADRLRAYAGMALTLLGLAATFSRGSWLATLGGSLILLLAARWRTVLRIWLLAAVALVLINLLSGGAISTRIANTIGDWVIEQRAALTLAGVVMFLDNPWVGVGPGGFGNSLEVYGPGISWLWDYLPTAQNGYVQMAAETGIVGLIALLAFYGSSLRTLLRGARHAGTVDDFRDRALHSCLLWALAVAIALGMVEWTFGQGFGQLIVLITAMGIAHTRLLAGNRS
jgi:putative inorganic carbon (hco3(-)) transporter